MREKKPKISTLIEPVSLLESGREFDNKIARLAALFSCEPVQVVSRLGELVSANFLPGRTPGEHADYFASWLYRYDSAKHRDYFEYYVREFWLDADELESEVI